jgi:predicted metalloprotease with PDZ domain
MKATILALLALSLLAPATPSQASDGPVPVPDAPAIPAPRDLPWPGVLRMNVDATDTAHRIFDVHETVPVQPGRPLVLLYPQWQTASHAASASVAALAGLEISSRGQALAWRRDPVNMFAFHVDVPRGTTEVELRFQFLSPRRGFVRMTPGLIDVDWPELLLYPAGRFTRNIAIAASLKLPPGMTSASSLAVTGTVGDTINFAPTTVETLTDSPVYAGRHVRSLDLAPGAAVPVRMTLFAESPGSLDVPASTLESLRGVVAQAQALMGSRHFRHYDFLVSLGHSFAGPGGVEHLESSEVALPSDFFTAPASQLRQQDVIAHEFLHSWNGRWRQPADLWAPNLNTPMRGSLLWVYEGLTQYWGKVVAARAGTRTHQAALDDLALDAALARSRAGRRWKPLSDSNLDPLFMIGQAVDWRDWTRREDYYLEGVLLWLDVDTLIRERSGERLSLDDFAHVFFGQDDGNLVGLNYTVDQLCAALNQVLPYAWAGFFRERLDAHDDRRLLDGLTRSGYRLVWLETPTDTFVQEEVANGATDLSYSVGMTVTEKGSVRGMSWQGPAFRAGLSLGSQVTEVNGQSFTLDVMKAAVRGAAENTPVVLVFKQDGVIHEAQIDYNGTLRYPHLQRIPGTRDRLSELLGPRAL